MRRVLGAVGATAAVGALLLGLSTTAANASTVPAATKAAAVAASGVYVGTYTYAGCINWVYWWNSQGYGAYCVVRGSVADLYVVA